MAEEAKQKRYKRLEKLKGKKILGGVATSRGIAVGTVRNVKEQTPGLIAKIKQDIVGTTSQRISIMNKPVYWNG